MTNSNMAGTAPVVVPRQVGLGMETRLAGNRGEALLKFNNLDIGLDQLVRVYREGGINGK